MSGEYERCSKACGDLARLGWVPLSHAGIVEGWHEVESPLGEEALVMVRDDLAFACGDRTVCAVGTFDGVHVGHRHLLEEAAKDAAACGCPLTVVTFDPHPLETLGGGRSPARLLETPDRLAALCLDTPADVVACFRFDTRLAAVPYDIFVVELMGAIARVESIHVGSGFRLGAGGTGTVDVLRALGDASGFSVHDHELVTAGGDVVSSSRVRDAVAAGDVDGATSLLGRPHFLRGAVVRGRGEGASFGFATANVAVDARSCLPREGVYAGYVLMGDRAWPAAVNMGRPPSFDDGGTPSGASDAFLEAHLLGFSGDLYGIRVAVAFVSWLRASHPFDSLDELVSTVEGNIDWVRENLGSGLVRVGAGRESPHDH